MISGLLAIGRIQAPQAAKLPDEFGGTHEVVRSNELSESLVETNKLSIQCRSIQR